MENLRQQNIFGNAIPKTIDEIYLEPTGCSIWKSFYT